MSEDRKQGEPVTGSHIVARVLARRRELGLAMMLSLLLSLLAGLLPAAAASRVQVTHVDASHYPQVSFQLHVTDPSGMPPPSLVTSQLSLSDGGRRVPSFGARLLGQGQRGTDVLMLIDVGPSDLGAQINTSQAASQSFISGVDPSDRVAVTSFAGRTYPLTPFTADKTRLDAALANLGVRQSQSRIYDALYTSLQGLGDPHQRYAVILLTDGKDVHSRHTEAQCVALARRRGIAIYTVALGTSPVLAVLRGLATGTGGQLFTASSTAQLQSIYRRLVLVFRHDYLLTYTAPAVQHRGQQVRLQLRYTPAGGRRVSAEASYTVPSAPWLHLVHAPSSLGTIEDPSHIVVPVTFASEDDQPQRVMIADSGWPGMQVRPSLITIPGHAVGSVRTPLRLGTRAGYPGGVRGSLMLHFRPAAPGVLLDRSQLSLPYRLLPSVLRIADLPADLHSVTDLGSGHTLRFTVYSTVFKPTSLGVQVSGAGQGSTGPSVLQIPSARLRSSSSQQVIVHIPGAASGKHGSMQLRFLALARGVRVKNGTATIVYYVPTWWERNWKWVVPSIILALILIYVALALSWEYLTRSWDTRRRAALGR